ncbi:uncharacterized protein LOC117225230 [Megalopta genalis]|uniref:uncharacterized protein LOC117225230 n=1 Tax=Megalopta genalis TaxID=115081 RepID=UPI003FD5F0D0
MNTEVNRESAATPEVCRVGIRIPPFWPDRPEIWFNQIEAQFTISGITADSTKFCHVMAQLDAKYAVEVWDIFTASPETDKYETLKRALIRRMSASESKKILRLFGQEEIGDRTPSQFLRHMQSLAGETMTETCLKTLWANRLPAMAKAIINAQIGLPLDVLADIADRIHEGTASNQVASVSTARKDPLDQVLYRLDQIEARMAERDRSRPPKRSNRPNYRSRSKSKERRRSASPKNRDHCWYHQVFGAQSTKCRPPCTYSAGNARAH